MCWQSFYVEYLLWGLEVSVDDFVEVQVIHASCDAHGPVHQEGGGDFTPRPQHLVQLALGAVLHQDTVTRSLGAHSPGRKHGSQTTQPNREERFVQLNDDTTL